MSDPGGDFVANHRYLNLGIARGHGVGEKVPDAVASYGNEPEQNKNGLHGRDLPLGCLDELQELISEPEAEPEEQAHARDRIDAIEENELAEGQFHDASHDKYWAANRGH